LESRSTFITGLAHVVALALLALGAFLLASDWPAHPTLTGVRRAALGLYLIANVVALEAYMLIRRTLPRAQVHFTAIYAGLSLNEMQLRMLALVNIGIAVAAIIMTQPDRWWLLSLAALGIFAFRLSIDFPLRDGGLRDWTIGEVIRHYAQESKRYARWLLAMQYVYDLAMIVIWLANLSLIVFIAGLGTHFAYTAFLAPAEPAWPDLVSAMQLAMQRAGGWMMRYVPVLGIVALAFGALSAIFEAAVRLWTRPRPADALSKVLRRDL
jgi:hypothetical protein